MVSSFIDYLDFFSVVITHLPPTGNGEWTGSIIHVETMHCRARILYAEEAEEFNKSKNPFVRWIYGA